ncbi:hypothetical protein [Pseudoalteromonas tunicata]|uniref:hypothetical protein n=1 Tax=Pseudoalteromonas tunicata TaxID=314281 RepID=UPI00273D0CBD|nr:hypothetical protein [Pseudoalteromonas tunicata]MDP4984321.1 hypothetical protein [Pseudoalteromonas tunicata]MDP5214715.1 hypothetical protein [Pseudoalteromonas tunicata]
MKKINKTIAPLSTTPSELLPAQDSNVLELMNKFKCQQAKTLALSQQLSGQMMFIEQAPVLNQTPLSPFERQAVTDLLNAINDGKFSGVKRLK